MKFSFYEVTVLKTRGDWFDFDQDDLDSTVYFTNKAEAMKAVSVARKHPDVFYIKLSRFETVERVKLKKLILRILNRDGYQTNTTTILKWERNDKIGK